MKDRYKNIHLGTYTHIKGKVNLNGQQRFDNCHLVLLNGNYVSSCAI